MQDQWHACQKCADQPEQNNLKQWQLDGKLITRTNNHPYNQASIHNRSNADKMQSASAAGWITCLAFSDLLNSRPPARSSSKC